MSQPPHGSSGSEFGDRPRPSFGQPGPGAGSSAGPASGASSGAGSHQPFGPSSASEFGTSRPSSGPGFGPSSASDFGPGTAAPRGGASDSGPAGAFGSGSTNPFGSAAPGVPAGRPGPTGESSGSGGKKRRNVGLILAIIGGVLLLISAGLGIGGVVAGAKAFAPLVSEATASQPNGSAVSGDTSETVLQVDKAGVVLPLIAVADTPTATCTITGSDGVSVTAPASSQTPGSEVELVINDTEYTSMDDGWLVDGSGEATVTCTGVTAPLHAVGPVGVGGTLGMLGLFLGAVAVGLLGLGLLVAGIIVMIVRASRNRRTA